VKKVLLALAGPIIALLLAPTAHADVFDVCPGGHAGVVGGHTSCTFANIVSQVYFATRSSQFVAYSPVTNQSYVMTCVGSYPAYFTDGSERISTRCYGGDGAEVVLW
jgi:hypothetical protein